jgi:hypothetical protein
MTAFDDPYMNVIASLCGPEFVTLPTSSSLHQPPCVLRPYTLPTP